MTEAKNENAIRYRQILDLAPAVIYLKDKQGRYAFINRRFEVLSGYSKAQVLGRTDFDLFPEAVARNSAENDRKVLESGIPLEIEEFGPVDGRMHTFLSAKFPIYNAGGDIIELCGISTDITTRKTAEQSLIESEERFRVALEANPDPVVLCDRDQHIIYSNPAFSRIFGWTPSEIKGRRLEQFIPETDRPSLARRLEILWDEAHMPDIETRHLTRHEDLRTVVINGGRYNDSAGQPAGCILNIRDISEQKRLQKQVQQARRLESLGRLSGGIAHNFNNLLMVIQGSVDLITMNEYSFDQARRNLQQILNCVKSGAELTQQLLGVGRSGKYMPEPIDVNENIRNGLALFSREASDIDINWNLEKGIWAIEADRSQIGLVLSSLFANARRVMPTGGSLFIASENITLSDAQAALYSLPAGRFVKISVSDTGGGLDQETQEHIFDPFFANLSIMTEEALGLASAYGIVRNHDGIITIDNLAGKGTTFNIFLPARAGADPKRIEKPIPRMKQCLTVLLVDDEKLIVQVGSAMLEKMGYEVLVARDGEEALRTFIKHKDKVGIVLLDMIMPGMGGLEVFRRLKDIDPAVKILLCSGYSLHREASRVIGQGCDGFIQKPFSIKDLLNKLNEVDNRS
jgi:two-component system cell cycle sensor histidine kinase/response regulator CckA